MKYLSDNPENFPSFMSIGPRSINGKKCKKTCELKEKELQYFIFRDSNGMNQKNSDSYDNIISTQEKLQRTEILCA